MLLMLWMLCQQQVCLVDVVGLPVFQACVCGLLCVPVYQACGVGRVLSDHCTMVQITPQGCDVKQL
jgi:hypothetical protein